MRNIYRKMTLFAAFIIIACAMCATGCAKSTPERTVRSYLQLLSGERKVTDGKLESLTTKSYRDSEHPHLASIATEQRARVDIAGELGDDPVIQEFMKYVTWETTYDIISQDDSSALVVARIIMTERRPGDREAAKKIPDLPEPLIEILERGLELPFQFDLEKVDGQWKIDDFTIPEILLPLLDLTDATHTEIE